MFPEPCIGVDNVKVRQTAACFEIHNKCFLFGSEGLSHDSESLVQLSQVIIGYHSLGQDFGGQSMRAGYSLVSSLISCP
jgi:hypothetical protein